MNKTKQSLIEAHIATLLISFNGVFAKLIHLSPQMIILLRSVIAVAAMISFLIVLKRKLSLESTRDYLIMVGLGLLLTFHWVSLFYAIQISTVAIGILALFTFPIITAFLEPIFSKSRFSQSDLYAGMLVLLGVILIVPDFDLSNGITRGVIWGVLSAASYALRNVISSRYVKKYPSDLVMSYQLLVVALVLSPLLLKWDFAYRPIDLFYLIILAILMTAVAHTLFIKSMEHLKVQTSSIIMSLQPIYSTILAMIILAEIPTLRTLFGGGIILLTVITEMKRHTDLARDELVLTE